MADTISISTKTLDNILNLLRKLTNEVEALKARTVGEEPPYGSEEWWEWSEKKADEDIKNGRYKVFNSAEELIEDLHKSLK